jgi:hypothetical protein
MATRRKTMHRLLGLFVSGYWTAIFGLFAFAAAGGAPAAIPTATLARSVGTVTMFAGGTMTVAVVLVFALTASLFLWMFVSILMETEVDGQADEVGRIAFSVAVAVMMAISLASAALPASGAFASSSTLLLTLLVSYLATQADRPQPLAEADEDESGAAARLMAVGAAHNSLLGRISGRPGLSGARRP